MTKVPNLEMDDIPLFGLTSNLHKSIKLREGMQAEQELQTFMHELLHAICAEYSLEEMLMEDEELIVDILATGIVHSLKHSPVLREYIMKQLGP